LPAVFLGFGSFFELGFPYLEFFWDNFGIHVTGREGRAAAIALIPATFQEIHG
jgi:hypothetical protein